MSTGRRRRNELVLDALNERGRTRGELIAATGLSFKQVTASLQDMVRWECIATDTTPHSKAELARWRPARRLGSDGRFRFLAMGRKIAEAREADVRLQLWQECQQA